MDNLRITEDLLLPDSIGKQIYALVDGSYILVTNRETRLYGEGYLAEDGVLRQIAREGEVLTLHTA